LGVVVAAFFIWYWSGRSHRLDLRGSERFWRFLPSPGRILATSRVASLSETLGLLIEHEVPLHDAVRLACDATGDRRVAVAGQKLADHLQQGGNPSGDLPTNVALPPRVLGLLMGGRDPRKLGSLLKNLAQTYHHRAMREAEWMRYFLPPLLTVVVGGVLTFAYATTIFIPFTETMMKLAQPGAH
jgi:general secretion pathway protein F